MEVAAKKTVVRARTPATAPMSFSHRGCNAHTEAGGFCWIQLPRACERLTGGGQVADRFVGHRQLRGDFSLSGIAPEALLGRGNKSGGFVAGKQHLPEPDAPIAGRGRLAQEGFPRVCFPVRAAERCVGARHLTIEQEFGRVGFAERQKNRQRIVWLPLGNQRIRAA